MNWSNTGRSVASAAPATTPSPSRSASPIARWWSSAARFPPMTRCPWEHQPHGDAAFIQPDEAGRIDASNPVPTKRPARPHLVPERSASLLDGHPQLAQGRADSRQAQPGPGASGPALLPLMQCVVGMDCHIGMQLIQVVSGEPNAGARMRQRSSPPGALAEAAPAPDGRWVHANHGSGLTYRPRSKAARARSRRSRQARV